MVFAGLELDHVSREMEGDDLAAPIVEQLVGSHRAALDQIEILGRFAIDLDLRVSPETNAPTSHLERPCQRVEWVSTKAYRLGNASR